MSRTNMVAVFTEKSAGIFFFSEKSGLGSVKLTPTEAADLRRVQDIAKLHGWTARVEEDKAYFQALEKLDEKKLVRARIADRQSQVGAQIRKFTGSSGFDLPRTPEFDKFNPRSLKKAYGSESENMNIKNALERVHKMVSDRASIYSTDDLHTLQSDLSTLRSGRYQSIVEANPDLKNFLDYAAARSGYSEFHFMGSELGP